LTKKENALRVTMGEFIQQCCCMASEGLEYRAQLYLFTYLFVVLSTFFFFVLCSTEECHAGLKQH